MSSLSPIGPQTPTEISGVTPMSTVSPPPAPYLQGTLDGVAGLLSLPTDSLRGALRSGQSISGIAAEKGVSRDSIVQYLQQQVQQQRAAQGQQPIDPTALDQVVNRAVDRQRYGWQAQQAAQQAAQPAAQPSSSLSSFDLLA